MRIISKQLRLKIRERFDEGDEFDLMCERLDIYQKDLIMEADRLWTRLLEIEDQKRDGIIPS